MDSRVGFQDRVAPIAKVSEVQEVQAFWVTSSGLAASFARTSAKLHLRAWLDMGADDLTEGGMRQGVMDAECFVMVLSARVLSRNFCLKV